MGIPESQLDTWSHQGSVKQSSDTYGTVKRSLEATDTKYADKSFAVFLQGSYGNDTNIYAESDVDVIIRLDSIYFYDTSELKPEDLQTFQSGFVAGTYSYADYKSHVIAALQKSFGQDDVKPGKKAVKIKANGNRRNADVVVATEFRRYYSTASGPQFYQGICFLLRMARGLPTIRATILRTVRQSIRQQTNGSSRWCESSRTCEASSWTMASSRPEALRPITLRGSCTTCRTINSAKVMVTRSWRLSIGYCKRTVPSSSARTRDTTWSGTVSRSVGHARIAKTSSTKSLSSGTTGCSIALLVYAPSGIPTISRFDHPGLVRVGHSLLLPASAARNHPRVCIRPLRSE